MTRKKTGRTKQAFDADILRTALLREELSLDEIMARWEVSKTRANTAIRAIRREGANLIDTAGRLTISRDMIPPDPSTNALKLISSADGVHRFGLVADSHYGSKYAREELVEQLYDWFEAEGITNVFHCGNWIDGERRFNKFDLLPEAHGMDAQLDLMVERYPVRESITTYYVAGDDHEGWYAQDFGVEIGEALQRKAREVGRKDLRYLGYKEAFVLLEHRKTKKHTRLLVDHPGGGSAYALSYAAQKRVEAAQGGEKPGIWCFGHWHKHGYFVVRNVHCILVPCTKDLDPFGRKKGLEYTLGGVIVEVKQDRGGAVEQLNPQFKLFFDRGYYNNQFTPNGRVRQKR